MENIAIILLQVRAKDWQFMPYCHFLII